MLSHPTKGDQQKSSLFFIKNDVLAVSKLLVEVILAQLLYDFIKIQ